jgi:plastocyanin
MAAVVGLVVALDTGAAPAALNRSAHVESAASPKVSVITVTAGKPSELAFKLSTTSMVPVGTVTFKVTNMGIAFHNFKICTIPIPGAAGAQNSCLGTSTPTLKHGQSATITVKFSLAGKYEFLCTVPGHAAAGMKGLLGVGVAVAVSEETAAAHAGSALGGSGGGSTTTTKVSSGGAGGGDTSGCPPGTTIKSSGASDADGDELGTEPDDNDGCI